MKPDVDNKDSPQIQADSSIQSPHKKQWKNLQLSYRLPETENNLKTILKDKKKCG